LDASRRTISRPCATFSGDMSSLAGAEAVAAPVPPSMLAVEQP
jgi:hypothetical protein